MIPLVFHNEPLKNWKGGKKIFRTFVNKHFGIYLSRPTSESTYITFLPEDKLCEVLPSEYAPAFNEMAKKFTDNMIKKMEPLGTLNDISDDFSNAIQENIIRERMKKFFKEHKRRYRETISECLTRFYIRACKKK